MRFLSGFPFYNIAVNKNKCLLFGNYEEKKIV